MSASRWSVRGLVAALVLAGTLALGAPGAAAQAPYEPNDSERTATPLVAPGTYTAGMETATDVDLFELYVAVRGSQVSFELTNNAGPQFVSDGLNGQIYAARDDEILAETTDTAGLQPGASEALAASLKPGKYYLKLERERPKSEPYGYRFNFGGGTVDEATMQGRCDAASQRLNKAKRRVKRAKRKLEQAFDEGSRRDVRQATKKVKRAKKEKRKAKRAVKLYCVVD